ncbi:MAG: hypothetical protein QXR19_15015 [Candidatus Jordarchaeaceae archaeon]
MICAGVESLPLGVCFVGVLGVYVFLIINVSLIEVLCEGGLEEEILVAGIIVHMSLPHVVS